MKKEMTYIYYLLTVYYKMLTKWLNLLVQVESVDSSITTYIWGDVKRLSNWSVIMIGPQVNAPLGGVDNAVKRCVWVDCMSFIISLFSFSVEIGDMHAISSCIYMYIHIYIYIYAIYHLSTWLGRVYKVLRDVLLTPFI